MTNDQRSQSTKTKSLHQIDRPSSPLYSLSQVIEPPTCYDRQTRLHESENRSYSCIVRVKGENSDATTIAWNKPKPIKMAKQNSSDFTIVNSDFSYRATYQDNGDPLSCFARNPHWNRTLPMPNCSLGILDIRFPPKLVCDRVQTFPQSSSTSLYVFCDILANPIEDLDSILWYVRYKGNLRRIEDFANLTRMDKSIANGYRSRLNVPHLLVDSLEGSVEFVLKIYYGGEVQQRTIRLATEAHVPTMYIYVGSALGGGLVVSLCLVACCWRCCVLNAGKKKKKQEGKEYRNGDVTPNGHASGTPNGTPMWSTPSSRRSTLQGNEIEVKPKYQEVRYHQPQTIDSKQNYPFGGIHNELDDERGRRVRFQNNL